MDSAESSRDPADRLLPVTSTHHSVLERPVSRRAVIRDGLILGSSLAIGGSLLAACSNDDSSAESVSPRAGGTALVSFTQATDQDKLDPARLIGALEVFAGGLLYNNLVGVDTNNQPIPALAEEWESDSKALNWTFRLREGVEFHNGKPFTSEDAAFTVRRVLDPDLGSGATALFAGFLDPSGVRPVDDLTLEFQLERPNSFLPSLLSTYFMRVLPAGSTPDQAASAGIGTGPFKLKSFSPGSKLEVEKNPNYWVSDRPFLDGVNVSVIYEQETKVQSVVNGDAHVGDAVPYSSLPELESNDAVTLLTDPGADFGTLVLFQDVEPGSELDVRKAFKHALDRETMLEQVYFGRGEVSGDVSIPPSDPFYPSDLEPLAFDPDRARSLLSDAGYPDGLDIELFTADLSPGMEDSAVVFQDIAQESGINVQIRKLPGGTYYSKALSQPFFCDFWLRQQAGWSLPLMFGSGSNAVFNESKFSDPRVDDLIAQAQANTDEAAQKQAIADAYEIINAEAGQLVSCFADRTWITKPNIHDIELNPGVVADFTNAFLSA